MQIFYAFFYGIASPRLIPQAPFGRQGLYTESRVPRFASSYRDARSGAS